MSVLNVSSTTQTTEKRAHEPDAGANQPNKKPRLNGNEYSVISSTNDSFSGNNDISDNLGCTLDFPELEFGSEIEYTPDTSTNIEPNDSQNLSTATITVPQQEYYALKEKVVALETEVATQNSTLLRLLELNKEKVAKLETEVATQNSTLHCLMEQKFKDQDMQIMMLKNVVHQLENVVPQLYMGMQQLSHVVVPQLQGEARLLNDALKSELHQLSNLAVPQLQVEARLLNDLVVPQLKEEVHQLQASVLSLKSTPTLAAPTNEVVPFLPASFSNASQQSSDDEKGKQFMQTGDYFMQAGDYSSGITYFKEAYLSDPNDVLANYWLGYFYMKHGGHVQGIFYLCNIPEKHELYFKAQDAIAQSYFDQGKIDEAIKCWEEALRIKTESEIKKESGAILVSAVHFHLGECYIIKKRFCDASLHLRKVPTNHPLHGRARDLINQYNNEIRKNKEDMGFRQTTSSNRPSVVEKLNDYEQIIDFGPIKNANGKQRSDQ